MMSLIREYHLCDYAERQSDKEEKPGESDKDFEFVPEASRRSVGSERNEEREEVCKGIDYHGCWQEIGEP